jgi:hypothetical protein
VSAGNAAAVVVAEEEGIAGEAVEAMIETETMTMVEGDLIAEGLDIQGRRVDVSREIEARSARIHTFPVAVAAEADGMTGEGHHHQNHRHLCLPGQNLSHVHHHLGVVTVQHQDLARQSLVRADLGLQIDVPLHIGEEGSEIREEAQIVEPAEEHRRLCLRLLVLHGHPSEEDPPHPNP